MFKTIREIWGKTYFGWYPIFRTVRNLFFIILIMGFIASICIRIAEDDALSLKRKLDNAFDNGWKVSDQGEPYLNVYFGVDTTPVLFRKAEIEKIVGEKIKLHNYRVKARRANRGIGLVVKEDFRVERKVNAYYSDDIKIKGTIKPVLWLISENVQLKDEQLQQQLKGKEIKVPVE